MKKKTLLLGFALLGWMAAANAATEFFVSPTGNDAADGSKSAPFKTLERAQKAVRGVNRDMKEDVIVYLREGTHQLSSTLKLTNADGGNNGHFVRYEGFPGETVMVSGGIPILNWELADASNNIWCARGVDARFRQLYVNGKKAIRARHPNVKANGDHYFNRLSKPDTLGRAFDVFTDQIKPMKNVKNAEIHVMIAWADQILRLDEAKQYGNITKLIPKDPERTRLFRRKYPMLGVAFMSNPPKQQVYYLENDYNFIDMEGEWFLDEDDNVLYYKPRSGEDMMVANVVAPNVETLIEISGESTKNKVQNISFKGITFAHTNFLRPSKEGFLNLQAGQYAVNVVDRGPLNSNEFMLWHPEAGIEVTNASRIIIEDNIFTQIAATGIDFTSGTNDTRIEGNVFNEIGGSGISIGKFAPDSLTEIHLGYNPSDKDEICTRDTVKNNLVLNTTNEIQGGVPILAGYPRYIVIEHNEVGYANYSGISVGFGWTKKETAMTNNKINSNEIHHIARLLCDGAAIYTLSNQGSGGEIMYNYSHDISGSDWADYWTCPIYQDEGTSGFEIAYNVPKNAPGGTACNVCGTNNAHDNNKFDQGIADRAGIESKYLYIKDKNIPLPDFSNSMVQEPFDGVIVLPGRVDAENYDLGGQGVAYYDKDIENQGLQYREDGVDIVTVDSLGADKGYAIGYTSDGEWLEYTVNASETSKYLFRAKVASGLDFSSFRLLVDGKAVSDTIKIPQTANWNTYTYVNGSTNTIEKGEHILRLLITGAYANIDWIAFGLSLSDLEDIQTGIETISAEGQSATIYDANGICMGRVLVQGSQDVVDYLNAKMCRAGVYVVKLDNGRSFSVLLRSKR